MTQEILSPKLDIIFKKIFTDNQELLLVFVCDLLSINIRDVQEISLQNNELLPDIYDGKLSRLDINLKINDILVNVEIQVRSQRDFFDRTLYYWSKLYTSELKSGEPYKKLKKAVAINITDFNVFENTNDWHSEVITVRKGTQEVFSDKFHIHFFELRKLPKCQCSENLKQRKRQELWLHFLNARTQEDITMLNDTNDPYMNLASKIVVDLSEDTRLRELARIREKSIMDALSELANAKDEGYANGLVDGRAEGRSEERNNFIKALRNNGMNENDIQNILNNLN